MPAPHRQTYIASLVDSFSTQPKKLYGYLRKLQIPSEPSMFINTSSELVTTVEDAAIAFNEFFHSTFTQSNYVLPAVDLLPSPHTQLCTIDIDDNDVYEALSILDTTKAMGTDNASPRVLKACACALCQPLTILFQACIRNCQLPEIWKVHKITPIPKSSNNSHIANYRPISLLCIPSKVLESIIYTKIIDFIRPRLSDRQFGFLSGRSSTMQLLKCYSQVMQAFEDSNPVDMLYLDIRKAFDSVPHEELLFKLWRIGITGPLWKWFRAYLKGRHHYVHYSGHPSPLLPVLSGVPQGSVLGPLLFLIYINDIPDYIHASTVYHFADDTKLLKVMRTTSDSSELQADLDAVNLWGKEWLLTLNTRKSAHLTFSLSRKTNQSCYESEDLVIDGVTSYEDLGILVQEDLSWSKQIASLCSKAYGALHVLRRVLQPSSNPGLKKRLYLSLVRSYFSYCPQLWHPRLLRDIANLEKVQRRATKFILGDYTSDYKTRLSALDLLPISYWLELLDLLFVVKCLRDPSDNFCITDYISFSTNQTRARSHNRLAVKYARTSTYRHFYFNRITRLWNSVGIVDPNDSLASNKFRLTKYFWNHFVNHFDPGDTCTFHVCCPCSQCYHPHQ